METTTCQQFTGSATAFIQKLISQRKRLISDHHSHINQAIATRYSQSLSAYLSAYHYTDITMAKFLVRHYSEILFLVPGAKCKSNSTIMSELKALYLQALNIIYNTPQPCKQ